MIGTSMESSTYLILNQSGILSVLTLWTCFKVVTMPKNFVASSHRWLALRQMAGFARDFDTQSRGILYLIPKWAITPYRISVQDGFPEGVVETCILFAFFPCTSAFIGDLHSTTSKTNSALPVRPIIVDCLGNRDVRFHHTTIHNFLIILVYRV